MGDCGVMKISVLNQENSGLDKHIGEKINEFCAGIFNILPVQANE